MCSLKATSRPALESALRFGQSGKDVGLDLTRMPEIISHDIARGIVLSLKISSPRQT